MQYFKLLKDYKGFAEGAIISVASPDRFADMCAGYGEPCDDPNIVKPKKKSAKSQLKTKNAQQKRGNDGKHKKKGSDI